MRAKRTNDLTDTTNGSEICKTVELVEDYVFWSGSIFLESVSQKWHNNFSKINGKLLRNWKIFRKLKYMIFAARFVTLIPITLETWEIFLED